MPNSLIDYPCDVVGVGDTVESIIKAYIENTTCVGQYKGVVKGIEGYNNSIKGIVKSIEESK